MKTFDEIIRIYIAAQPIDLRKGIDGYAVIVQSVFKRQATYHSLYIFCNKSHNKIKCLYYDGTGFWLLYKRLEKGTFKWKMSASGDCIQITEQQLKWLLEGLKMEQKAAFEPFVYCNLKLIDF